MTPNPTMTSLIQIFGWQRIGTGGNCDALSKPIPGRSDGAYWLITEESGCNIPPDIHTPVMLGAYTAEGDEMQVIPATFPSLVEAILSTERR